MKLTYNNPVFKDQCKKRDLNFDELNTGWVEQVPLDQIDEEVSEEELEEELKKSEEDDDFYDEDELMDEEDDLMFQLSSKKTPEPPKPEAPTFPDITEDFLIHKFGENVTNRDKITQALDAVDSKKLKLNIDKTAIEKPKLKLNFKDD